MFALTSMDFQEGRPSASLKFDDSTNDGASTDKAQGTSPVSPRRARKKHHLEHIFRTVHEFAVHHNHRPSFPELSSFSTPSPQGHLPLAQLSFGGQVVCVATSKNSQYFAAGGLPRTLKVYLMAMESLAKIVNAIDQGLHMSLQLREYNYRYDS